MKCRGMYSNFVYFKSQTYFVHYMCIYVFDKFSSINKRTRNNEEHEGYFPCGLFLVTRYPFHNSFHKILINFFDIDDALVFQDDRYVENLYKLLNQKFENAPLSALRTLPTEKRAPTPFVDLLDGTVMVADAPIMGDKSNSMLDDNSAPSTLRSQSMQSMSNLEVDTKEIITITCPNNEIVTFENSPFHLPLVENDEFYYQVSLHPDINWSILFRVLEPMNILRVMTALLTEQKVLMISKHPSLFIGVGEILLSLIYPFQWIHFYRPFLLPSDPYITDYLASATPGFFGMLATRPPPYFTVTIKIKIKIAKQNIKQMLLTETQQHN